VAGLAVRRPLVPAPRFEARFAGLCLRDAPALVAAVFVDREADLVALLAAVRRTAFAPPRDLDAAAFVGLLLRDVEVFDPILLAALFLELAVFLEAVFLKAAFFVVGRPRALVGRRDFETVLFGDLAIQNSYHASPTTPPHLQVIDDPSASTYGVARCLTSRAG
jgi:hypothetical protein